MSVSKFRAGTSLSSPANILAREPRLGNYMWLVAGAINELGEGACGLAIADYLEAEAGIDPSDTAQIYGTMQRLLDQKLISREGTAKSESGPPLKLYKLTALGAELLSDKEAHIRAQASLMNRRDAYRAARERKGTKHVRPAGTTSPDDRKGR